MDALSLYDLQRELLSVTSTSDARALTSRAARVVGVPQDRPLELGELLQVCAALAAEGGMIQELAEAAASRALRP